MLYLVGVVLILLVIYTMGKEFKKVMATINEIKAVVEALKGETAATLERVAADVAFQRKLLGGTAQQPVLRGRATGSPVGFPVAHRT